MVVRRVLRGRTGPTGGPAMTDLLGVMESWSAASTVVRAEDGTTTEIALRDIVSGKPVPPRPSVRMRVSAEEACRRSNGSWPAVHVEPMGEWLLRASGGFSGRANSAMAAGDPGVPLAEALDRVVAFYRAHDLPPVAQVVAGSTVAEQLGAAGWVPARPGEEDTVFQIAPVAQASRAARRLLPPAAPPVSVGATADAAWLANDERVHKHAADAIAVLQGPEQVGFLGVPGPDGPLVARGRVATEDDWAGITDVWVDPAHRRRRLSAVVVDAMLGWAAERGARTSYLQVRGDNAPALAAYAGLGFRTHHTYRYLAAPPGTPA